MPNEQSLRSNTAADNQFSEFIEPEQAVIEVVVRSNIRQVGKLRLASKIQEFLVQEGYTNVQGGLIFTLNDNAELLDAQKRVQVRIGVE